MDNQTTSVAYKTGTLRSEIKPRYRDIATAFLRRIGLAFQEGSVKYEQNLKPWEKNWKTGDIVFALDAIDHAVEHLLLYKDQILDSCAGYDVEDSEDHLGHLGANLSMLSQFEEWGFFQPEAIEPAPEPSEPSVTAEEKKDPILTRILNAFGKATS